MKKAKTKMAVLPPEKAIRSYIYVTRDQAIKLHLEQKIEAVVTGIVDRISCYRNEGETFEVGILNLSTIEIR